MKILTVVCYVVFSYGLSNIVVLSEGPFRVFEWWRAVADGVGEGFGKLFNCMLCFSTWVGVLFSVVDFAFTQFSFTTFNTLLHPDAPWWLIIILDGGFTGGAVWLLHSFQEACERHGSMYYYIGDDD